MVTLNNMLKEVHRSALLLLMSMYIVHQARIIIICTLKLGNLLLLAPASSPPGSCYFLDYFCFHHRNIHHTFVEKARVPLK